ncbi:MAG: hypothetical protein ABIX37_05895 [Gammaproteobacteria bacterium]
MSLVHSMVLVSRLPILALVVATSLGGVLITSTVEAAQKQVAAPAAPKLSGLKARVGQGGRVDLAASSLTSSALAALRPGYENLKPRARTTAE